MKERVLLLFFLGFLSFTAVALLCSQGTRLMHYEWHYLFLKEFRVRTEPYKANCLLILVNPYQQKVVFHISHSL